MSYIVPEGKPTTKRELSQLDLDHLAKKIDNLRKARSEVATVAAYIKTLELEIKAILGDHEEGTINNVPVVRYQKTAKVAWAQFVADNPGIAKEYTVDKTVGVLDEEGIRAAHASLIEPYYVRNFTVL